jgi:hypothetical protein
LHREGIAMRRDRQRLDLEFTAPAAESDCRIPGKHAMMRAFEKKGRRTQVAKGEVCKTSMQRFESARRLQFLDCFYWDYPIDGSLFPMRAAVSF